MDTRLEEKLREESIVSRRAKYPYKVGVFALSAICSYCYAAGLPSPRIPLLFAPITATSISTILSTADYVLESIRYTKDAGTVALWGLYGAKKGFVDGAKASIISALIGSGVGYLFGALEGP